MLNRLKEITLLKVKFPLRCKLHYFASLFFFSSSVLGLCLVLSGLGNFVVDCHIQSTSSSSVFANVAKK